LHLYTFPWTFPKDWIPGQAVHVDNLRAAEVCSADATELPVWKRPPVSVANGLCHPKALDPGSSKLARDDTVYSLMVLVSGNLFTFQS